MTKPPPQTDQSETRQQEIMFDLPQLRLLGMGPNNYLGLTKNDLIMI